jgi:hypothetical protein
LIREDAVALYRAADIAEGVAVPEFYISEIGMIENLDPNIRVLLCSYGEIAGARLLIPQVSIVRPACGLRAALAIMRRVVPERSPMVFGEAFVTVEKSRGHH